MSNYRKLTKMPGTGAYMVAEWLDDYFGPHRYGVRFPDGQVFNAELYDLPTKDDNVDAGWMGLPDDAPFGQEEYDYTPKALPSADAQGEDNLAQPSAGEQPTSVEAKIKAAFIHDTKHISTYEPGMVNLIVNQPRLTKVLANLVSEERRQAKIQELERWRTFLAIPHIQEEIDSRITELRGENNE